MFDGEEPGRRGEDGPPARTATGRTSSARSWRPTGPSTRFALNNGESAEFLSAGQAFPSIPAAFGKKSVDDVVKMWTPGAIETCGGYLGWPVLRHPFRAVRLCRLDQHRRHEGSRAQPRRPTSRRHGTSFVAVAKKLVKVEGGVTVRNGFMCNSKEGVFNFLVLLRHDGAARAWTGGRRRASSPPWTRQMRWSRGLKTYTDFVTDSKIWDPALASNDREGFGNEQDRDVPHGRNLVLGRAGHLLGEAQGRGALPVSALPGRKGHRRSRLRLLPLRVASWPRTRR